MYYGFVLFICAEQLIVSNIVSSEQVGKIHKIQCIPNKSFKNLIWRILACTKLQSTPNAIQMNIIQFVANDKQIKSANVFLFFLHFPLYNTYVCSFHPSSNSFQSLFFLHAYSLRFDCISICLLVRNIWRFCSVPFLCLSLAGLAILVICVTSIARTKSSSLPPPHFVLSVSMCTYMHDKAARRSRFRSFDWFIVYINYDSFALWHSILSAHILVLPESGVQAWNLFVHSALVLIRYADWVHIAKLLVMWWQMVSNLSLPYTELVVYSKHGFERHGKLYWNFCLLSNCLCLFSVFISVFLVRFHLFTLFRID